jgi:hypothetical protein
VNLYRAVLNETDPQKRLAQIEDAKRVIKQALRSAVKEADSELRRSLSDALQYLKLIRSSNAGLARPQSCSHNGTISGIGK